MKKSHRVSVRLSSEEWERLRLVAEIIGESLSSALRLCLKDSRPVVISTGDEEALREVSRQVAKIGGHTNQIARVLNSGVSRLSRDERAALAGELSRAADALAAIRIELAAIREREGARVEEAAKR